MKTRLSESQAEAEELNQSQSLRTCIVIGSSYRFCFRLRQSYSYSGYQMRSFVDHRPTRLRLTAEDTSSKAAIIKKKTAFRAGHFWKIDRSQKLSMKACMKSLTPEIQDFLSHWSLSVSATSSFSMQRSDYRKFRSKEMWPFLSFIFISLQRLALTTLSVLTLSHSLVKPLLEEQ